VYDSPRRLCRFLEGLAIGSTRRFGERLTIVETACMREGAEVCVFELRFSPRRLE
jgi:predicted hydrocarbon binding protein